MVPLQLREGLWQTHSYWMFVLFLLGAIFSVCLFSLHIVWIICVQTLAVPSSQSANSCVTNTNQECRRQNVPLVQELQQLHPPKCYNDKKYSQGSGMNCSYHPGIAVFFIKCPRDFFPSIWGRMWKAKIIYIKSSCFPATEFVNDV